MQSTAQQKLILDEHKKMLSNFIRTTKAEVNVYYLPRLHNSCTRKLLEQQQQQEKEKEKEQQDQEKQDKEKQEKQEKEPEKQDIVAAVTVTC